MRLKSLSFSSSWRFVGCPAVQSHDPRVTGQYFRRAFYSVQFEFWKDARFRNEVLPSFFIC